MCLFPHSNSGDTSGERDRVVGYGAVAFHAPQPSPEDSDRGGRDAASANTLDERDKATLLRLARDSIAARLEVRGAALMSDNRA